MRYNESKFTRFVGSSGFYVIVAFCLIAIGSATWFLVSRYNNMVDPDTGSSSQNGILSSSQPSSVPDVSSAIPEVSVPSAPASKKNSDVPYSSEEDTSSVAAEYFSAPVQGNITKGYSDSELQYSATFGDMRIHEGVDIICEEGTAVLAAGDGTVSDIEESASLGKIIVIDHGNGITVKYCGVEEISVKKGKTVKIGDEIAVSGTVPCECADQSHIHIEVYKDGKAVSPLKALGLQ